MSFVFSFKINRYYKNTHNKFKEDDNWNKMSKDNM